MLELLSVGAGGFLGSICRYLVAGAVQSLAGATFPYGTLLINTSGCLAIGYLGGTLETQGVPGPTARLFLMVGFLGGYTTWSTFALESLALVHERSWLALLGYVGGHMALGFGAVALGFGLSRWR